MKNGVLENMSLMEPVHMNLQITKTTRTFRTLQICYVNSAEENRNKL